MNNLMLFEDKEVEIFQFNNEILFNPYHVGRCLDIDDVTVRRHMQKMNDKQVIKLKNSDVQNMNIRKLNNAGENFLTEKGIYKLIFKSHKPEAERFQDWVTDEVLPTIRKTGGYVANEDMFVDTYLPFADDNIKSLFKTTLYTINQQNKMIKQQQEEIVHKENIIIGLVENIDLATKRQRITQIIRKGADGNYSERYNLLYEEFERKYHIDLARRISHCNIRPKIRNKMDYIDRELCMIPELYEICCKLFENDVKILIKEWESIV